MPRILKKVTTFGYLVLPSTKAPAPRDIGNPAKAKIDTRKWLKGEGPVPEQFGLLLPADKEALDEYRRDLWVHPERITADGPPAAQFRGEAEASMRALAESETTRFRAIVDRQRDDARIGQEESRATVITRTEEWKKTALMRAQQLRQSSSPPATLTRLVMTMCGSTSGRWNPKAQWQWRPEDDPRKTKDKTKHHITADTLYRYLRAQQLFS